MVAFTKNQVTQTKETEIWGLSTIVNLIFIQENGALQGLYWWLESPQQSLRVLCQASLAQHIQLWLTLEGKLQSGNKWEVWLGFSALTSPEKTLVWKILPKEETRHHFSEVAMAWGELTLERRVLLFAHHVLLKSCQDCCRCSLKRLILFCSQNVYITQALFANGKR